MKVGRRIREIRLEKNLSQAEIAKATGISQSYYNEIENEKAKCPIDTLEKICDGIGISLSEFFCDDKLRNNFITVKNDNINEELHEIGEDYYSLIKEIKDKKIPPEVIRKIIDAILLIEDN